MEQHEKGFQKVVRKDGLFMKDLNLGLFDPLEDVKDGCHSLLKHLKIVLIRSLFGNVFPKDAR